jgi:toxin ParE1/3/4
VRVSTHPLAAAELVEAAAYYTHQASADIAQRFVAEFERAIALLLLQPQLGAPWRGPFRRLPLRRFPYSVVYVLSDSHISVIALAHQRRKPDYWQSRLAAQAQPTKA